MFGANREKPAIRHGWFACNILQHSRPFPQASASNLGAAFIEWLPRISGRQDLGHSRRQPINGTLTTKSRAEPGRPFRVDGQIHMEPPGAGPVRIEKMTAKPCGMGGSFAQKYARKPWGNSWLWNPLVPKRVQRRLDYLTTGIDETA